MGEARAILKSSRSVPMSTGVGLLTRSETISLYRSLLRSALTFPSVRRASIVSDIRSEFREHKGVTDQTKLKAMVRDAECALFELRRFEVGERTRHPVPRLRTARWSCLVSHSVAAHTKISRIVILVRVDLPMVPSTHQSAIQAQMKNAPWEHHFVSCHLDV